ncbi:MAG: DUF819 domain-containing protein [Rubrobacteraceae bacterium]
MTEGVVFNDPFAVGAVVTALIALAFFLDRRFRVFSFFGTAIVVITGAALLVNLRVIPPSIPVGDQQTINPIYVFASDYAVPLAIVLLLMTADLRSLRRLGRPAIMAFVLGAVGTLVGAFVGGLLLAGAIGPESWKISGQFAGSYIGGGVNYAAVGEAVGTSDTLFATGAAADTLMTNLWFVLTALVPVVLLRFYPSIYGGRSDGEDSPPEEASGETGEAEEYWEKREISIYHIVYLLAATFVIVAVSTLIAAPINELLGFEIPVELWYTTLALLAALTPANRLNGGEEIGNVLLHFFFAVLGAGAVLSTLVGKGPVIFLFLVILVSIHGLIIFGVGRLLKIEIETLSVASQACVGGPSTALALAISKKWRALVTPAVLIGVLGYAIGNYAGVGMAFLLRAITG